MTPPIVGVDPNTYAPDQAQNPTAAQIAQMYQYANALNKSSMGPVPGTKGGWTVGMQHMAEALMGGLQGRWADEYQQNGLKNRAGAQMPDGYGMKPPALPTTQPPIPFAPEEGAPAAGAMTPGQNPYSFNANSDSAPSDTKSALPEGAPKLSPSEGSDLDRAAAITARQESGGKYDNVTTTRNRQGKLQSAMGRYGVMDFNVPEWTQEALGKSMTPREFLANPEAQDAVYKHKMGQYMAKYGPEGAGRAWLGGPGGVNNPQRRDALGTSVGNYGREFARAYGAPTNDASLGPAPQRMALNAEASKLANSEGQEAIVNALQAGATDSGSAPQTAQYTQNKPQQGGYAPEGGWDPKPLLPPGAFPTRPRYTPEQLYNALRNPALSEAERKEMRDKFDAQFQPITVPVTGGTLIINPFNPNQQKFIGTLEKGQETLPGGYSGPVYNKVSPMGNSVQQLQPAPLPAAPARPAAPAAPARPAGPMQYAPTGQPAAPAPAAPTIPPSGVLPGGPSLFAPPTPGTPGPQGAAPEAVPPAAVPNTKLAALNTGTVSDAGPLGANPPMPPVPQAPLINKPPVMPAGPQVAQAQLPIPPGISPQTWDKIQAMNKMVTQQKQAESTAGEMGKEFGQRYQQIQKDAGAARELRPQMDALRNLLQDPSAYTGTGSGAVLDFQRAKAALGQWLGDKDMQGAASSNELIRKLISGSILSQLKPMTQGTGQIRNKEIELIERFNANTNNSLASNRALVEVLDRALKRTDMFASMAADYAAGNPVVNPYTGKEMLPDNGSPRGGLDFGWDRLMKKFGDAHPAFTPEETKDFTKLADEKATPTQFAKPPAGAIDILKKDPNSRPFFEKRYGPADQYLK